MVSFSASIYECTDIHYTGISVAILYFSVIYSEKSQRKKTGSMEYPSGEHDRLSGIYFSTLFQTSDRFFQNDDLFHTVILLLVRMMHPILCFDKNIFSFLQAHPHVP